MNHKQPLPFPPFKTKTIEKIPISTRSQREEWLKKAGYNLFQLLAKQVTIDLLTDSGTSAMSDNQWAALMKGDESYAGADSFLRFRDAVQRVTGMPYIVPTHQGRSAENLFFSSIIKPGDLIPNNTHFDTTEANLRHKGGIPINLPSPFAYRSEMEDPFKGNIDLKALEQLIAEHGSKKIPVCMITITNNSAGGAPVSMENLKAAKSILSKAGISLYLDCARFAENAFFIQQNEPGYTDQSIEQIASEMFSYADGALMSAKKDALVNIGGFVATHNENVFQKIRELMVVIEGFPTYGGLAGRDMDAIAVGLIEVLDETYLAHRIGQIHRLAGTLRNAGVPILWPPGGHAVYLDAGRFLPHIPGYKFPGQALSCKLYMEGGIRSVEIGSVMFACKDPKTGEWNLPQMEMVRLAIPRRVYHDAHLDYVADTCIKVFSMRDSVRGMRFTYEPPRLRHFLAQFDWD